MYGIDVWYNSGSSNVNNLSTMMMVSTSKNSFMPLDPLLGHLLHTMQKNGRKRVSASMDSEEELEFLEQLLQSRELNSLVKAHNVILFCNQEQCPCVSNACEIAADVMEDVRPFALMIEECRELFAILTTPHIRVKKWRFILFKNKSDARTLPYFSNDFISYLKLFIIK